MTNTDAVTLEYLLETSEQFRVTFMVKELNDLACKWQPVEIVINSPEDLLDQEIMRAVFNAFQRVH